MAETDKLLTFSLGGREFGVDITRVREIIGYTGVTPVPARQEPALSPDRFRRHRRRVGDGYDAGPATWHEFAVANSRP